MGDLLEKLLELGLLAKGIIPEEDEYDEPIESHVEEEAEKGRVYWRASSVDYLRAILETLSTVNEEVPFAASADGLRTAFMDIAHISLIALNMEPNFFYEYEVEGEEVKFALDLKSLLKILRIPQKQLKDSYMEFKYPAEGDRAKITIISQLGSRQEFYIDAIDLYSICPIPKLTFEGRARLSTHHLYQIIKQAESSNRWEQIYVTITMSPSGLTTSAKSDSIEMSQTIDR